MTGRKRNRYVGQLGFPTAQYRVNYVLAHEDAKIEVPKSCYSSQVCLRTSGKRRCLLNLEMLLQLTVQEMRPETRSKSSQWRRSINDGSSHTGGEPKMKNRRNNLMSRGLDKPGHPEPQDVPLPELGPSPGFGVYKLMRRGIQPILYFVSPGKN